MIPILRGFFSVASMLHQKGEFYKSLGTAICFTELAGGEEFVHLDYNRSGSIDLFAVLPRDLY